MKEQVNLGSIRASSKPPSYTRVRHGPLLIHHAQFERVELGLQDSESCVITTRP